MVALCSSIRRTAIGEMSAQVICTGQGESLCMQGLRPEEPQPMSRTLSKASELGMRHGQDEVPDYVKIKEPFKGLAFVFCVESVPFCFFVHVVDKLVGTER